MRADVIEAAPWPARCPLSVSDADLVREMERRIGREPWISTHPLCVEAHRGVLELYGLVDSEAERAGLVAMARAIPGCVGIADCLLLASQVATNRR
jgi:hypothetical protein